MARNRTNYKELPSKPDITITKYKIAVFIDSEFWYSYDWEHRKPRLKRNRDYWIKKIEYNMKHDEQVNTDLEKKGVDRTSFLAKPVLKNPDYYTQIILWHIKDKV